MTLGQIRKAVAAAVAFAGVLSAALADGHVTSAEAGAIGAAALGVVGVFSLKNERTIETRWADARELAARFGFQLPAVVVAPDGTAGDPADLDDDAELDADSTPGDVLDLDDAPPILVSDEPAAQPVPRSNA